LKKGDEQQLIIHFAVFFFSIREVQNSTGFGQYSNTSKDDEEEMPAIVENTIKANMEDFEYLRQFCIKL
jgi:hypothetical protein